MHNLLVAGDVGLLLKMNLTPKHKIIQIQNFWGIHTAVHAVVRTSINVTWCQPSRLVKSVTLGYSTCRVSENDSIWHGVRGGKSQIPTANITFYCMCFTLWQGYFSAIVESRAAASHVIHYLMTQGRVHGEGRTLSPQGPCFSFKSLSGFHPQPMGILFFPTLPGFSCDCDTDFPRKLIWEKIISREP